MASNRQRQLERRQPAVRLEQRARPDGPQPAPPSAQPQASGSPAASSGYQIDSGGLMTTPVYAVTGASGRLGRSAGLWQ
jgi:hypothetical protein